MPPLFWGIMSEAADELLRLKGKKKSSRWSKIEKDFLKEHLEFSRSDKIL